MKSGEGHTPLVEGQKEPLDYDVHIAIKRTLYTLLSAWIDNILPGHLIQLLVIPPKKGPPSKLEEYELQNLLMEFNDLMKHLNSIEEAHASSLCRKRAESHTAFVKRIAEVVQSLHDQTRYSIEMYRVDSKTSSRNHDEVLRMFEGSMSRKVRLQSNIALSIARQSIGGKGKVRPRQLVYSLLAAHHPYLEDCVKVRGHIERAEAKFPQEHRYKAPRRSISHDLM